MNNNFNSSRPDDFTYGPDETIYFSALRETKDRQLFRLEEQLNSIDNLNINLVENLIVYPSPSEGLIHFFDDYAQIQIFNLEGKILKQVSVYKSGEPINLSHLESNVYIVIAISPEGKTNYGKFVIK